MDEDLRYLKIAINNSKRSAEEGNFPAGALVIKDGDVLSSEVSSPYPSLFHADSKAVTEAFNKIGKLEGATLYIGLQSCLMCTGVAYWGGIRRIVYAVPKSKISSDYHETPEDTAELIQSFNESIEVIHLPKLEEEALNIVREWESKQEG